MTPFSVAVIANEGISIKDFYNSSKNLSFSRIPVFRGKRNNISGFILKDQVLQEVIENRGKNPLSSIKKHVPIVSNEISISDLFEEFVHKHSHIAVIVDEYGNTVGLVTMEDIIETLFGLEIMDESDDIEDMQVLAKENWEKRILEKGKYNDPGEK
jgi:CBS domain containing-hemolysin-like protein